MSADNPVFPYDLQVAGRQGLAAHAAAEDRVKEHCSGRRAHGSRSNFNGVTIVVPDTLLEGGYSSPRL